MNRLSLLACLFWLSIQPTSFGCLWDTDTLAMERERFPEAHELIAGHFVRHSRAYYQWRIDDRTAKPLEERTPADFDDIAVAYEKLGKHDQAIRTIEAKLERWPDQGLYESEANLGTFLIHAGRLEEGLSHIVKAIEINPEAHFGREVYQQLLVQYVIASKGRSGQLPLSETEAFESDGFAEFVIEKRQPADGKDLEELQAAAKGVMGMMRFGNHDSPILLEALGDLLMTDGYSEEGAKMLAARSFLKASYAVDDPEASAAYRLKAEQAIEMQFERELPEIEADLKREMKQAEDLLESIARDEAAWIRSGSDLDKEFAAKYFVAPLLDLRRPNWKPIDLDTRVGIALIILAGALAVGLCLAGLVVWRILRWRNTTRTAVQNRVW